MGSEVLCKMFWRRQKLSRLLTFLSEGVQHLKKDTLLQIGTNKNNQHCDFARYFVTCFEEQLETKDEQKPPCVGPHLPPARPLGQYHHLFISLQSFIFSFWKQAFLFLILTGADHQIIFFSVLHRLQHISLQPLPKSVELLITHHSQNVSENVSNLQLRFRVATLLSILTEKITSENFCELFKVSSSQ